ncbi:MAG: hypothetical protein JW778_00990 [Candidatus Altiarchaeota archaeon]|nr:hypothetical protein [Candidatus Altiarchaeota archaeon]
MWVRNLLKPDRKRVIISLVLIAIYLSLFVFIPVLFIDEFWRYFFFSIFFSLLGYPIACLFSLKKNTDGMVFLILLVMLPALLYYAMAPTDELCVEYMGKRSLGGVTSGVHFIPRMTDIVYYVLSTSILASYMVLWFFELRKRGGYVVKILKGLFLWVSLTLLFFFLWTLVLSLLF